MAAIRPRHNRFEAKVRVPLAHRQHNEGREFLYRTLAATSRKVAQVEADAWEAGLRVQWAELDGIEKDALANLRSVYQQTLRAAADGKFVVHTPGEDPFEAGIDYAIERIAEATPDDAEPTPVDEARLAALHDARAVLAGKTPVVRKEFEPSFSQLAADHMKLWRTQTGLKDTNTAQQKEATFALFAGYWQDRPIRDLGRPDAARFMDALRHLDPTWARSAAARRMSWEALQRTYGDR